MTKKTKHITISSSLYQILQEKVARTKFQSVDTYAEHVLCQILQTDTEDEISEEEEEEIKERLRNLGYL